MSVNQRERLIEPAIFGRVVAKRLVPADLFPWQTEDRSSLNADKTVEIDMGCIMFEQ